MDGWTDGWTNVGTVTWDGSRLGGQRTGVKGKMEKILEDTGTQWKHNATYTAPSVALYTALHCSSPANYKSLIFIGVCF